MKKALFLILIVLSISLLFSSCGGSAYGSTAVSKEKAFTTMEQSDSLDGVNTEGIMGISPDGKYLLIRSSDKGIDVMSLKDQEITETTESPDFILSARETMWSQDGSSYILGDSNRVPSELQLYRSVNVDLYSLKNSEGQAVTDEDVSKNVLKGGSMIYSPSWSADGKSIIYSLVKNKKINICKTDVKSGNKTVLYKSNDLSGYEQGIELKKGLLLCEYNGNKPGENYLFLYDGKKDEKTSLDDVVDNQKMPGTWYEIKGWSKDRRTVLINKWVMNSIQKCFILDFNANFTKYETKSFEYSVRDATERLVDQNAKNVRLAYSSLLSPEGRYLITCEDEATDVKDGAIISSNRQLVLRDLLKDEEHILYETDKQEIFGIGIRNEEPLFMTENGMLMVLTGDGYKMYELK